MKKVLCWLLVLCLSVSVAAADTIQPYGISLVYDITEFSEQVPEEIAALLSASCFGDDYCQTGVMVKQQGGSDTVRAMALVEHEGSQILLGIGEQVTPLAENFCSEDAVLTAKLIPSWTQEHESNTLGFFVESQGRAVGFNLVYELVYGMECDENGSGWLTERGYAQGLECYPVVNGISDPGNGRMFYVDRPINAEYWTLETYPCTMDEAADIASNYPLDTSLTFISGCNLRTEATSKSKSLGILTNFIPVTLTGNRKAGTQLDWVEVQINDQIGWVSENYVVSTDSDRTGIIMYAASQSTPVGILTQSVEINGIIVQEGTLVYVVA